MPINVYILATSLSDNLDATLLVFRTLRVGFPTLPVVVHANGVAPTVALALKAECKRTNAMFVPIPRTSHDYWVETLLNNAPDPFWILDTDMVFHASVEGFVDDKTMFKGRYEPAFVEPWSKTLKTARLHTALLYFNAPTIRHRVRAWIRKWHPARFPFTPLTEMIRQCYVPQGSDKPPWFYDTAAGLYMAIGGEAFSEQENAAFDHLHCATYVQQMKEAVPGLAAAHRGIYENIEATKALKEAQAQFYREHAYA